MKFGDIISGTITQIDQKGRGVLIYKLAGSDETREVMIPFTAIGDQVEATFVKRDQGKWIAKLETIVKPSDTRVAAPCPHAGVCGGCLWQHMAYPAQLELKKTMINQALTTAGHDEQIKEVQPSTEILYYRNRMDYVFGWKGELGLKEYGSWSRYVDLSTCLLLDEETPKILSEIRTWAKVHQIIPWDAKKQTGQLRYTVIRLGKNTGERMITLVVKNASELNQDARHDLTHRLNTWCTTLYIGENPEISDLSYAKTFELLQGNPFLCEEVNGLKYTIHPNSFFQTNTSMAAKLQNTVLTYAGDLNNKILLDLYCGLGFFGIAAARQGAQVFGHELDAPAIELAKQNAELNGVADRAQFTAGAVEDFAWNVKPDVVIIDPPRAGLHPRALELLLKQAPPEIIYVSCNYHSFAKELAQLKSIYHVERLTALDLFPQTPHVELVTKLVKNG